LFFNGILGFIKFWGGGQQHFLKPIWFVSSAPPPPSLPQPYE